jgi:hypothetical protein
MCFEIYILGSEYEVMAIWGMILSFKTLELNKNFDSDLNDWIQSRFRYEQHVVQTLKVHWIYFTNGKTNHDILFSCFCFDRHINIYDNKLVMHRMAMLAK